ncbi:MAG: hypothetical protein KatS3mg077_1997 [Candidatus Binatia bacterium]|nr:MAG: hypothetical protein KatS3mg077_1997 [Candidatus Binatia bacterium]
MTRIAIFANLLTYSTVASQPLFYSIAFTAAQRALSAGAYVELRQRINAVMTRRVPVIYLAALVTSACVLALSWYAQNWNVLITTALALVCLVADIALMLRENVPINGVMDRWSATDPPADWERYRNQWFFVYRFRQVILLLGFASILLGAVFQN